MKKIAYLAAVLAASAAPALAQTLVAAPQPVQSAPLAFPPGIEADVGFGFMSARSREYVYDAATGAKLSQLNWKDGSIYGVNGALAFRFMPWLTARATGFFPVSSNSSMQDYDWIPGFAGANGQFTHYSTSPDTRLQSGYKIDLSLQADVWTGSVASFGVVGGLVKETWKWKAYGGDYVYSIKGFRDTSGSFDANQLGIAYQQWWDAPYLGLVGSAAFGDLKVSARGIGSPYVFSSDYDNHALRGLVFKERFRSTQMYGGDLKLEYALAPWLALVGTASYERYLTAKGKTFIIDANSNVSFYGHGSAGADREAAMFTVGLSARR